SVLQGRAAYFRSVFEHFHFDSFTKKPGGVLPRPANCRFRKARSNNLIDYALRRLRSRRTTSTAVKPTPNKAAAEPPSGTLFTIKLNPPELPFIDHVPE